MGGPIVIPCAYGSLRKFTLLFVATEPYGFVNEVENITQIFSSI